MRFEKLNHSLMQQLQQQGFNILRSNSILTDENPTWIPDTVDMDRYFDLDSKKIARISIPMQEIYLLVIDDALRNIDDDNLMGEVLIVD